MRITANQAKTLRRMSLGTTKGVNMLVVAKSKVGADFPYAAASAHTVRQASAQKIAAVLNDVKYGVKAGETWFVHEVWPLDRAYGYGEIQSFSIYKGVVRRKSYQ